MFSVYVILFCHLVLSSLQLHYFLNFS